MAAQTQRLPAVPPDPFDWRPQRPLVTGSLATRKRHEVTNAIIEPLWEGDHVLAHYQAQRPGPDVGAGAAAGAGPTARTGTAGGTGRPWLRLIADSGEDVSELEAEVGDRLREAILAEEAVIDGFLTPQATRGGASVSLQPSVKPGRFNLLYTRTVETDVSPPPRSPESPVAFVAVDLLRVDGQELFDIPLLERKRLLEAILVESERVRVSPFTQPPLGHWLRTWRAAGFRGVVLKAANSRYRPGHESEEWVAALSSRR